MYLYCFIRARLERRNHTNNEILTKVGNRFLLLACLFLEKSESIRTINAEYLWRKFDKLGRKDVKVTDFDDNFIYRHFRFKNQEQLRRLLSFFSISTPDACK